MVTAGNLVHSWHFSCTLCTVRTCTLLYILYRQVTLDILLYMVFFLFYNKVQLWHTEKRVGCFWGWGKCLGVGDGWWIAVEFCLFSFLSFLLLSMLSRLASILATFSKYSLIYLHLKANQLLGDDGGKRSMR